MVKQNINNKKGFTIIEVVLVLAIAGLIFLMVFIALPALQRSQRNTQRRDDYSMLSTAVTNYMSNNGGRISNIVGKTLDATKWINESGEDPNGNPYTLSAVEFSDDLEAPEDTEVFIVVGANCNGEDENSGDAKPSEDMSQKAFAIYGYMEGATAYCQASGSIGDKTSTSDGE